MTAHEYLFACVFNVAYSDDIPTDATNYEVYQEVMRMYKEYILHTGDDCTYDRNKSVAMYEYLNSTTHSLEYKD